MLRLDAKSQENESAWGATRGFRLDNKNVSIDIHYRRGANDHQRGRERCQLVGLRPCFLPVVAEPPETLGRGVGGLCRSPPQGNEGM